MSDFYIELKERIAELETKGIYIPTNHSRKFPKIDDRVFEPEGKSWHAKYPIYSKHPDLYHKNVLANCKPLSSFTDIPSDVREEAM